MADAMAACVVRSSGHGSGECCSCAAGAMLSPGAQDREAATLLTVILAVPSQRLSTLLSMIDKVFMLQHSCRAVASNRHGRSNEQKKTRKEATLSCSHSHAFCVFLVSLLTFSPIPTSSRPFRRREGTLIPYVSPFLPNLRHPEYRYSIPERPGSCVGGIFPAFARRDQRLARCP